ncbi:MAG: response regulator [Desulfuromonadales bacterium]
MARFPVSILCVDDDPANLDIMTRLLSGRVETMLVAADGREGHALFVENRPDIVLTDLMMPVIDGLEMSCLIRSIAPRVPIILLTACNSIDFLSKAVDIGITQFLPIPILKEKLLVAIQRCYDIIDLERRLKEERERAEAQLLRTRKLESLGVLAGGIAHNFNNILTAIIGNAELALMLLPPDSDAVDCLKSIENSAGRAAVIAKQMLDYSGKSCFISTEIDLNDLLEKMQEILEVTVPGTVTRLFVPASSLCPVKGDATQLRQVVMNLVINAVEAMGDHVGTLRIATGCMECSPSYLDDCWFEDGTAEGKFVFLDVSDTGCGMDKDTIAKLFDPFFSTKFTGRGLGMAAVLGIVRWHKGAIHIVSEPGAGSRFRILFPAIPESAVHAAGSYNA